MTFLFPSPEDLALVVSPMQLLVVGGVLVMFIAPQLIPFAGRLLGRLARKEVRRRLGPLGALVPPPTPQEPPTPKPRLQRQDTVDVPAPLPQPAPSTSRLPTKQEVPSRGSRWQTFGIVLVVFGAAAVLSWYLLHAR
jgi:hypothetical protein